MTVARYALGAASLLLAFGSLTISAWSLRRRLLADWTGAVARLAEIVIGLALLVVMLEILGTIGLFRLGPIVAASLVIGIATWRLAGPPTRTGAADTPAAILSHRNSVHHLGAGIAIALLASAAVIAAWAGPTLSSYEFGIRGFDSLWYHLPWAGSFAQTGHITPLRFTDIEYLTQFYPATAELVHGLGIVLLGRDTLSPGLNLIWLAVVLLAAYCIGRPRGLGHATLLGAAVVMATPTLTLSQGGSAANDVVGVFFLLAAVAFVTNAEGRPLAFVLAAIAAGLAVATKLSLLGPALALTVGVLVIAPAGKRRACTGLWLVPLALAGGFWYLRNLIVVGNPLPWVSFPGLATPAPALQQHTAFSVAHYATDTHIWSTIFGPGLQSGFGNWWPALVLAAVIGAIACLLPGSPRELRMLSLVALASLLAYVLTPESAAGPSGDPTGFAFNLRYAAPGLTLCMALLPLAPVLGATERARQATVALLAILLVAMLASGQLWPSRQLLGAIAIGVVVLIAGLAAARGIPHLGRVPVASALILLLLAGAAGGYAWQRRYLDRRYEFQPGVSFLSHLWAKFRGIHDARVGLVGTYGGFFSYPLFGADDSNRVQYVGRRGPHGSFAAIASCPEWRRALNAGHFNYVVTTPARDPWQRKQLTSSPEGDWTAADPSARLVYSRRADGQPIAVYALRGPLDPSACGA